MGFSMLQHPRIGLPVALRFLVELRHHLAGKFPALAAELDAPLLAAGDRRAGVPLRPGALPAVGALPLSVIRTGEAVHPAIAHPIRLSAVFRTHAFLLPPASNAEKAPEST